MGKKEGREQDKITKDNQDDKNVGEISLSIFSGRQKKRSILLLFLFCFVLFLRHCISLKIVTAKERLKKCY